MKRIGKWIIKKPGRREGYTKSPEQLQNELKGRLDRIIRKTNHAKNDKNKEKKV